jgi:histone-lysine N-methyltransferase SETD7
VITIIKLYVFPIVFCQVSFYVDGMRIGPSWRFKIGGGFVVGKTDSSGHLTGNEIVYSYPDFETLLVGHFVDGIMRAAKQSKLRGVKFDKMSKIPYLLFDKNLLKINQDIFTYEPSNKTSVGANPLLPDPFESQWIYTAESTIPGAGVGVFTRTAGKRGMMVSFYNGIRMSKLESRLTIEDRQSGYKIDNDWAVPDEIIDIPQKLR